MPAETDMYRKPGCDAFFGVHNKVVVTVPYAPKVGPDANKQFVILYVQCSRHIGNFFVKILQDPGRTVCNPIAIPVFQHPDFLFFNRKVAPVVYTVVIQVREPLIFRAFFFGKSLPQECPPVFNTLESNGGRHPIPVSTDIEFRILNTVGTANINPSLIIDVHSDGVRDKGIGSPQANFQSICEPYSRILNGQFRLFFALQ